MMVQQRSYSCSLLAVTAVVAALSSSASAFTTPSHGLASRLNFDNIFSASPLRPLPSSSPSSRTHYDATTTRCRATIPTEASVDTAISTRTEEGVRNSKLRQLKDRMWVREALEDITAAEFATSLSVENEEEDAESTAFANGVNAGKKKRKRAVDYNNILNKLDVRIEEMCVLSSPETSAKMGQTCYMLARRVASSQEVQEEEGKGKVWETTFTIENSCYSLDDNVGMGSVVYAKDQREALLKRLVGTRERLMNFIDGNNSEMAEGEMNGDDIDDIRSQLKLVQTEENAADNGGRDTKKESGTNGATFDPSLYVREDGTVDWDGALQDREALKKFGSAVWSRINGQDPETNGEGEEDTAASGGDVLHSHTKAVTAKIEETPAIREKRDELDRLVKELQRMEVAHTKLLNSAIGAGQAVANVNLATVPSSLRKQIRDSSDLLESQQSQVTFQNLNYELERIYTYLIGELGNTAAKGYIPLQDRLNVAEFGLLESQADSFTSQIELGENLDADVLAVVSDQLVDFKRRLGIDYYVTGLTFDTEAIQVWLKDIWLKTKNGFTFYVKGTRLFSDDVLFCSSLILKALGGYTLKPREVRTLRRTFKDTITFIPVVIILIIPLTPIGHVLVFGAIQRVFPDFFPSCFTERRQNLLELYESTEYSAVTINESGTQKLVRISQAIRIFILKMFTDLYTSLGGVQVEQLEDGKTDNIND